MLETFTLTADEVTGLWHSIVGTGISTQEEWDKHIRHKDGELHSADLLLRSHVMAHLNAGLHTSFALSGTKSAYVKRMRAELDSRMKVNKDCVMTAAVKSYSYALLDAYRAAETAVAAATTVERAISAATVKWPPEKVFTLVGVPL